MGRPFFYEIFKRRSRTGARPDAQRLEMMKTAFKLESRKVEKPWGRTELPALFGPNSRSRIGEIWFEAPDGDDLPLLPKYLFTSEPLSIQVHPGDEHVEASSVDGGKVECWYVVEAEAGARIGFGLERKLTAKEAREAVDDGSIEELLAWRPVQSGEFIFVPAGTVHAIGAGLTILEVQQNSDIAYRLFDFERPRELHVAEALAVADLGPADPSMRFRPDPAEDRILVSVPEFTVAHVATAEGASLLSGHRRWVLPVAGTAIAGGESASRWECLLVPPGMTLELGPDARALIAAEGQLDS